MSAPQAAAAQPAPAVAPNAIRYDVLHEYADKHRLSFNELCSAVRAAVAEPPAPLSDAQDAMRYRWLRSIDSYAEWNRVGHYAADALDAAIDAAMAAPESAGEAK